MNFVQDSKNFTKLCQSLGNPYTAVMDIATRGRQLADSTDNLILHSESITWAISGEPPKVLPKLLRCAQHRNYTEIYINEILSSIDDVAIRQAVNQSIRASRKTKNLVYRYADITCEHTKARIRVLTKIVWYELFVCKSSKKETNNYGK